MASPFLYSRRIKHVLLTFLSFAASVLHASCKTFSHFDVLLLYYIVLHNVLNKMNNYV